MEQNELKNIVSHFAIRGTVSDIKPLGAGLINDTLLVTTAEADAPNYVLQRVNTNVFPDVDLVMRNIYAVTTHIRKKLEAAGETEIDRKVLTFMPSKDDETKLYAIVDGQYWRMMIFIENAITKQAVNPESSRAAGKAFGQFQAMLADIPVELGETIKDFHNMEFRLQQLREVIAKDPVGRVAEPEVQAMLKEINARAEYMCQAERMGREGVLPKRVCHCDTKVNNMMFDQQDNVLCVIDLDTVMPNFIFSDYGDFLRTGANKVAEDFQDMDAVCFDVDIFKAFTEGYLSSANSFLTRVEIENLPYAVKLFPYMQCVRFLWDYLSGDKYWKCQYDNHNFVRANNQLHLLLSIEKHESEMEAFIADCLK
ncbi:MAG: aminoglycoside phosphotransferase family protein [Bacteroidaceae bacterium]|jgi:Ser/Thr protein kinase RdoA (MazF antagonist)|nr:aminoglycoside phosphotransferase family protein [Bacteroidaceae bacterium]